MSHSPDAHRTHAILLHNDSVALHRNGRYPQRPPQPADLLVGQDGADLYVASSVVPDQLPPDTQLVPLRQLISQWPAADMERLARAAQLLRWRNDHHFCSRCGTSTHPHPSGEPAAVCPNCHYSQYPRLQPVVIVAVVRDDRELLLARASRFQVPMFGLVAGFVEVGETLEQAVAREVHEEVGLQIDQIEYMSSQPWPFPSNLMIGFKARYVSGEIQLQEDELIEAGFFAFDQLPLTPPKGSIAHALISAIAQPPSSHQGTFA